jgi:NADH-quinone oxidoreductase subunit H
MFFFFSTLAQSLLIIGLLLLNIAYLTLLERKILATIQRRQGPNVVGIFGILQPLVDGGKLLIKETIPLSNSNKFLFLLAPVLSLSISLFGWGVIPFSKNFVFADIDLGMLFILSISSLGVYGIIISGWSSNSKYAFLGALRSSAQMVSYELPMTLSVLCVIVCAGSLNINDIIYAQETCWYVLYLITPFFVFFISGLAETNRHPFDLPEAESELVSGYNVEYSAMGFALFSLAEYSNILLMCTLNVILFFGGWHAPFTILSFLPSSFWMGLKITLFATLFVFVRAILPRYRYDQLMLLSWQVLLPISFGFLGLSILSSRIF